VTGPIVLVLRLLALAALYAYLGLALWIMGQTLRRASDAASTARVPVLRLEIRQKGQPAASHNFTQSEVLVGRDPLADVPLKDKAVSTRHARLSFHDGHWWIDDLRSTNGTRLNREPLTGATVLAGGDEIKCGSARLLVSLPGQGALMFEEPEARDDRID
jgi:pSer/pThr/pTyr-binding forkhead associated (FHA) protein